MEGKHELEATCSRYLRKISSVFKTVVYSAGWILLLMGVNRDVEPKRKRVRKDGCKGY